MVLISGASAVAGQMSGMPLLSLLCGSMLYYHCSYRSYTLLSLLSDLLFVLLCSLAVLGLLFRHCGIPVPIDPLEWEISQDTANQIAAFIANIVGAAVSVFRVTAKGEDKKLFLKVVLVLYLLSALGRAVSGATVAYLGLPYVFPLSFVFIVNLCISLTKGTSTLLAALLFTLILLGLCKLESNTAPCQSSFLYRRN